MPLLNPKKHKITTQKQLDNDFKPINSKVSNLESVVIKLTNRISKLEKQQLNDNAFKEKFNTYISYTDKKRMNTIQKDINLVKKQINLSKSSKIMISFSDLQSKLDKIQLAIQVDTDDDDEDL
jgi:hypothetical protein